MKNWIIFWRLQASPYFLEPNLFGHFANLKFLIYSTTVFGVSTESMQLSYDSRGNIVPTILLLMQGHLYAQGGLRVCQFTYHAQHFFPELKFLDKMNHDVFIWCFAITTWKGLSIFHIWWSCSISCLLHLFSPYFVKNGLFLMFRQKGSSELMQKTVKRSSLGTN